MSWSRSQYEDRIRGALGDLGLLQHIAEETIPGALEAALATFTKDKPQLVNVGFDGTGTDQVFNLTGSADFILGWSRVMEVEHPVGDIPRTLIDSHHYRLDEITGELIFDDAPASGSGNIKVTITASWPFPEDDPATDLIPEIFAHAVADLAASRLARGKAVEYARQASTSVAGDLFQRDPGPLFQAAADLKTAYEDTVLGRPATGEDARPQVAMAVADVDVFPASLFHRRADYIAEESLGD